MIVYLPMIIIIQGNLFYESVRLPKDINATGIYRVHWLNPVYLPYNPIIWSYIVSVIQASSHMLVPQMPPYITGVTHWESLHHFLWHYNGPRQCCYKILALLCFPILSVSVAYFSWPHLIGTQVFYIMAGIGYNHSYFQKYKLVTEKAELSGNPRLAYFPGRADTLMNVRIICIQYSRYFLWGSVIINFFVRKLNGYCITKIIHTKLHTKIKENPDETE